MKHGLTALDPVHDHQWSIGPQVNQVADPEDGRREPLRSLHISGRW
jgi:hypothetical protein